MIIATLILGASLGCCIGNVIVAQKKQEIGWFRAAVEHEFYAAVWFVIALCAGGWLLI